MNVPEAILEEREEMVYITDPTAKSFKSPPGHLCSPKFLTSFNAGPTSCCTHSTPPSHPQTPDSCLFLNPILVLCIAVWKPLFFFFFLIRHIVESSSRFTAKLRGRYIETVHMLPAPHKVYSLPRYQHSPPEWYVCYNPQTYTDTS